METFSNPTRLHPVSLAVRQPAVLLTPLLSLPALKLAPSRRKTACSPRSVVIYRSPDLCPSFLGLSTGLIVSLPVLFSFLFLENWASPWRALPTQPLSSSHTSLPTSLSFSPTAAHTLNVFPASHCLAPTPNFNSLPLLPVSSSPSILLFWALATHGPTTSLFSLLSLEFSVQPPSLPCIPL